MPDPGTSLHVVRDVDSLRRRVASWRGALQSVALVPTMGALHAGHMALVERAKALADAVVVSIFVNPSQFGPEEDLTAYPRPEADDWELLDQADVDLLYRPGAGVIYPDGFQTSVSVRDVSQGLCGDHRPGHFQGVATVVTKLLLQALPDMAVFGEKDYQQLIVIKRLVKDLNIPTDIVGVPTVREDDGLALSSRNAYLSAAERRIAPTLYKELTAAATEIAAGADIEPRCAAVTESLLEAGFSSVDYVEVRDAETLAPITRIDTEARLLAAATLGNSRLIDNVAVLPAPDGELSED